MEQSKNKRNRIIILLSVIGMGMIVFVLYIVAITSTMEKSRAIYEENQDVLADTMLNSALKQMLIDNGDIQNAIITEINENFPTSSSVYCIISIDDKIVYLKDENTTSTLNDETLSGLFDKENVSTRDNQKYFISLSETQYKGSEVVLTICTKQSYLVKKGSFNEVLLHCLGYFTIYATVLIIIIILLFYKLRSIENTTEELNAVVKNNRLHIEKLQKDKNNYYANSEKEGVYSFYNRIVVNEVISSMKEEEKIQCVQIDIIVENLRMEHFVLITAILGRIKLGNSIACYWEENKFKVLLFHAGEKEAQGFIHLFISKYKSESEEKVEELKIVASRLS